MLIVAIEASASGIAACRQLVARGPADGGAETNLVATRRLPATDQGIEPAPIACAPALKAAVGSPALPHNKSARAPVGAVEGPVSDARARQ